jgi:chemotaxis protein MotB
MKRKRRHTEEQHAGSHGSWKVAYADFVTAMMAFFLLLWLLSMTSDEQKARLSTYFTYFSLFDKSSSSIVDLSQDAMRPVAVTESDKAGKGKEESQDDNENKAEALSKADALSAEIAQRKEMLSAEQKKEQLQERLKEIIESKLADVKSQVIVDALKNCVRVQMVDEQGSMMFPTGSTIMTPKAREIIKVITETVKGYSGDIAIEGHTDGRPYPSQIYTNWELSLDRASAARKEMVICGLNFNKIVRVSGFADKKPINKEDALDPRNRRISILFYKPPEQFMPVIKPMVEKSPFEPEGN